MHALVQDAGAGRRLTEAEALALCECPDLALLMATARGLRDTGHGAIVS
jgi:2-iminoacetate synthase ThiH